MPADGKQVVGAAAEVRSLLGDWVNSKDDTDHLARITVSERDGVVVVRPYAAAGGGEPADWGEAVATPHTVAGGTEAAGFHARYEIGAVHTELAANEKLGILVIQSYTSFQDDSGRPGHHSREFFHRADAAAGEPLGTEWVNSSPTTSWIRGFTLTRKDGAGVLRVLGAGEPADWGEVPATLYQDNIGEPAFSAVYDLGHVEATLAANSNKGLVVIAAFLRFTDEERPNFLCREFFFRGGPPALNPTVRLTT